MNNESNASKSFAEWMIAHLKEHPDCEITLFAGFDLWNEYVLEMRDRSKDGQHIMTQQIITNKLLDNSKLAKDEILIFSAEKLRKELDKYGS